MSRIIKSPNRKTVTKHDIIRAVTANMMQVRGVEEKLADLDILFGEFVEMLGKTKQFRKYLDGKFKQKEHKRSGGSTPPSK